MKKIYKRIFVLCLTLVMAFTASGAAFALDNAVLDLPQCGVGEKILVPVGDAEYILDSHGNQIPISVLPSFETREEADAYMEEVLAQLNAPRPALPAVIDFRSRMSHGDSVVDQENAGFGTIALHITYTTSGDNYTGKVTSCGAYTGFSGFTLGFGWDERTCYAQILSSGKDVYGYAAGELTYNLLIDGFIELGREAITLSGTAYAAR